MMDRHGRRVVMTADPWRDGGCVRPSAVRYFADWTIAAEVICRTDSATEEGRAPMGPDGCPVTPPTWWWVWSAPPCRVPDDPVLFAAALRGEIPRESYPWGPKWHGVESTREDAMRAADHALRVAGVEIVR